MVDRDLILAKASSVKRHLNRVIEKRNIDLQTFLKDIDCQESILFRVKFEKPYLRFLALQVRFFKLYSIKLPQGFIDLTPFFLLRGW